MKNDKNQKDENLRGRPDPERMLMLRRLPLKIKESLTKEEVDAFLYDEEWPPSLEEKLKDFLVDD
jgi:hypothetical protein